MRMLSIGITIATTIILFKCQSNEKIERDFSVFEVPSKNNLNDSSLKLDTSNCALLYHMLNPVSYTHLTLPTKRIV